MAHGTRSMPLLSSACRCRGRPLSQRLPSSAALVASFSTTAARPAAAKTGKVVHKRGVKSSGKQKSRRKHEPVRRATDEQKNIRKRIVLSNVNALEVADLKDLERDTAITAELRGTMLGLPGPVVDQLRAVEAFKPRQNWGMFRRPAVLVTQATVELASAMDSAGKPNSAQRRILVGDRGAGKSVLLLQAMALAFLRDWVVISIPDANPLVNAHTAYGPVANSSPRQYTQKAYTAALLGRTVRANPILAKLKPVNPQAFPTSIASAGSTKPTADASSLADFAARGAADPEIAWATFEALWAELSAPERPPVLLALDGASRAMRDSEYRASNFSPIHAHDLALVRWFVDRLGGHAALPNGGLVLAATSRSDTQPNATLDLQLRRLEALQAQARGEPVPAAVHAAASEAAFGNHHIPGGYAPEAVAPFLAATGQTADAVPRLDPLARYDQRVLAALGGADGKGAPTVTRLPGLDHAEARALMEYWARSGLLRARLDDAAARARWSVAGGGIVGELEKTCLRMRI